MCLHLPETGLAAQVLPHQTAMGLLVKQLQQHAGPVRLVCLHDSTILLSSYWCVACFSSLSTHDVVLQNPLDRSAMLDSIFFQLCRQMENISFFTKTLLKCCCTAMQGKEDAAISKSLLLHASVKPIRVSISVYG